MGMAVPVEVYMKASYMGSGRVRFMALVLKTRGGDEPSVGSNPTSVATYDKSRPFGRLVVISFLGVCLSYHIQLQLHHRIDWICR